MRTARMFGWVLAGLMAMGSVAMADSWKDYKKHMDRYYKHLDEAAEEAAEGDWDEYHEEMAKARADYRAAQNAKPKRSVVVVPSKPKPKPRRRPTIVIYR